VNPNSDDVAPEDRQLYANCVEEAFCKNALDTTGDEADSWYSRPVAARAARSSAGAKPHSRSGKAFLLLDFSRRDATAVAQ
jgi:hypothetical protein